MLIASTHGGEAGGGGLIAVDGSSAKLLDRVSSTGIAWNGSLFARSLRVGAETARTGELVIYDTHGVRRYLRVDAPGIHDIAWDGELLAVVSTWRNAVHWISPAGEIVREIRLSGEINARHVNGLTHHNGVWYVTMFGDDSGGFRWWSVIGRRSGAGRLAELESGRVIADGFSAPHSPRRLEDLWLVCNSDTSELLVLSGHTGRIVKRVDASNWTRGITWDDRFVYVGTCFRRGSPTARRCEVLAIDRTTWKIEERIPLPSQEVFDLTFVPDEFVAGLRIGFDVNPTRAREARQFARFAELGVGQPRTMWPVSEPLPPEDFRCTIETQLPQEAVGGTVITIITRLTNRGASFFSTAPPLPVTLSYKWLRSDGNFITDEHAFRSRLPRALFPHETIDVETMIAVPRDFTGRATLCITPVQDGIAWFDDIDPTNAQSWTLTIR